MSAEQTDEITGQNIWVDVLTGMSCLLAVVIARRQGCNAVRYLHASRAGVWFAHVIGRLFRVRVICVDDVEYGLWREDQQHLIFEALEDHVGNILRHSEVAWDDTIVAFSSANDFDRNLVNQYLRHHSHFTITRPAALLAITEAICDEPQILMLRTSPFKNVISAAYPEQSFIWHRPPFFRWKVQQRYLHNAELNKNLARFYLTGPGLEGFRHLLYCACAILMGFVCKDKTDTRSNSQSSKIAVQMAAGFFEPDQINDLYWLGKSGIDPADVTMISAQRVQPADITNLANQAVRLIYIAKFPDWLKARLEKTTHKFYNTVLSPGAPITLGEAGKCLVNLWRAFRMAKNQDAWLGFWLERFRIRTLVRTHFFRSHGFRILFDNNVENFESSVDTQALLNLGGIRISTQNCHFDGRFTYIEPACDIYFTWGQAHAQLPIFKTSYIASSIVPVGHALDKFRDLRMAEAAKVRKLLKQDIQIAFIDQGMAWDGWCSPARHADIWSCLLAVLERHPEVGIIWKPKKNLVTDININRLPGVKSAIDAGRITILATMPNGRKVSPIQAGFAADFTVTNGFTSSGLECTLHGLPALFYDPSKLSRNFAPADAFGRNILTKPQELEDALEKAVKSRGKDIFRFDSAFVDSIDPWRDGRAAERTGLFIQNLHKELPVVGRERAMEIASDIHIKNWHFG